MTRVEADRNLLLGMLALQSGDVDAETLMVAMGNGSNDGSRSLGQTLVESGVLSREALDRLEDLADEHVARLGHQTVDVINPRIRSDAATLVHDANDGEPPG